MSRYPNALTMHRPKAAARGMGVPVALALALALSACAASPLATFDLSAPATDLKARVPSNVLAIPEPSAPAPADSDRIMVRTGASAVAVVRGAQWSERLPRLLQSRLIQTFENAKLVKSVSRPGDGSSPDRALAWDVRRFEIDTTEGLAKIEISVRLLDSTGKILAAQIFTGSAPGEAGEGAAAAQSLDEASHQVLRQIVTWAASRI